MLPWLFREGEDARFDEQVLEALAQWVVDGEPRGIVVRAGDADATAMRVLASLWTARSHGLGDVMCWVPGSLPPLMGLAHIRRALPRPTYPVATHSVVALALDAADALSVRAAPAVVVLDGLVTVDEVAAWSRRLPERTLLIAILDGAAVGDTPGGFLDIAGAPARPRAEAESSAPAQPVATEHPLGWFCPRTPIPAGALGALAPALEGHADLLEIGRDAADRRVWALRRAFVPPSALCPDAVPYLEALLSSTDRSALFEMLPHLLRVAHNAIDGLELVFLAVGQCLREAGDPEAADPWLLRAYQCEGASAEVRALAGFERAKGAMYVGRWEAAAEHIEPLLPQMEDLFGPDHLVSASVLDLAAQVQYQMGDWRHALARGHDAIVALGNAHGPWSDFVALALGRQGEVLLATGDAVEAQRCLTMAVSMSSDTLGDEHRCTRTLRDSWHQAIDEAAAVQRGADDSVAAAVTSLAQLLRTELSASRWLQVLAEVGLPGDASVEEILGDLQPFPAAWRRLVEACDRHLARGGWPHVRFRRLAGIAPGAPSPRGHFVVPDLPPPPAGAPWSEVLGALADDVDTVLVGPPGVGKSAVAAWHGSICRHRRYPGGVFWVEPRPDREPVWNLAAFADQIWGHLQVGVPEKAHRVAAYLRGTRSLLVLDDLREDTAAAWRPLLPGGLCRTLVTARSPVIPDLRVLALRPDVHPLLAQLAQAPAPDGDERALRRALGRCIDAILGDVTQGARTVLLVASIAGMESLELSAVAEVFEGADPHPFVVELCARHLLDGGSRPPALPTVVQEHMELSAGGPDYRAVLERLLANAEGLPATTRERVWGAAGRLYPLPAPLLMRWVEVGIKLAVDELAADHAAGAIPRLRGLWGALEESPRPHLQAVVAYHLARGYMALGALTVAAQWFVQSLGQMELLDPAPDDVETARSLFVTRVLDLMASCAHVAP